MVGCFFVMLLYVANPKLRPFPGWIVIATSFGLFLISWGVFSTSQSLPQVAPQLMRALSDYLVRLGAHRMRSGARHAPSLQGARYAYQREASLSSS